MSDAPLFSVVIPAYNRARVIGRAIGSVLAQTLAEFELIVVDDGSADGTREVVQGVGDPRVRYHFQENAGRSAARNEGARLARGAYLTFLDSDDEVSPEWLATLTREFEHDGTGVVCCGATVVEDRPGLGVAARTYGLSPRDLGPVYDGVKGRFNPPGTFALRREIFDAIGGYEASLAFAENTDLTHRLVAYLRGSAWRIRTVDASLVVWHFERGIGSQHSFREQLHAAEHILRRYGPTYRRHSRKGYSNYCAIAGVNSVRLGSMRAARRHFLAAIRACPWWPAHHGRLALTFLPPALRGRLARTWQVPTA
jgi:glycosyltransferase involved in cell wall biosynthesis